MPGNRIKSLTIAGSELKFRFFLSIRSGIVIRGRHKWVFRETGTTSAKTDGRFSIFGRENQAEKRIVAVKKWRVLVVDDEPTNLFVVENMLSDDYDLMTLLDPQETVEKTVSFRPDLILLDIMMPEMNGFEVCERLKADAALKDLDKVRSDLGSVQNQLNSTIANITTTRVNVLAAESSIREVDFADEASTFTKMQVLMQASTFALAQANASSQQVLSLLQ